MMRKPRGWVAGVVVLALPLVAFGIYLRVAGLFDVLCRTPDELAEMMPGLRLHALPLLNVGDAVRYTFLKSAFYSQHGLGDTSFYYLASGVLGFLGLPISERNLFLAGGVTNLGLAVAGGVLCAKLLGGVAAGWIFGLLVMVSPLYVFVSRTGWARLTWTPFLLMLLFLAQWRAMHGRRWPAAIAFVVLAGFLSLTDGFYVLPVVLVLGLLLHDGNAWERVRALARDRIFLAGFAIFSAGIVFDLVLGLAARRHHTNLTLMGYVFLRGTQGSLVPTPDVLAAWARSVDWYFPFRGAWLVVTGIAVLALREGLRGRPLAFVAVWWLIASLAVIRYATGIKSAGVDPPVLSRLNAFHVALPSLLLVAWFLGAVGDGTMTATRRLRPAWRGALALTATLLLAVFSARDAHALAFDAGDSASRFDACRTVKAAAFYVRGHGAGGAYVFHLSSDVFLGHFGEFYYGLSYGGSIQPDESNRLLDFGLEQFQRRYPPQAFYRAYGVPHFDYYVDFVTDREPFRLDVVRRLESEGARVVCTIRDGDRIIGRILSFRDGATVDVDYRAAAREWDRRFARLRTLIRQPLAGTAYHFGYNWRKPE